MYFDSSTLRELGWGSFFDEQFGAHAEASLVPARVAVQHRGAYVIYGEDGELSAELAGKMQGDYVRHDPGKLGFEARVAARLPAIGDWIAASVRADERRATIHATLPRRTQFSRKQPWNPTEEQVLAANIDTVFVVSALAEVAKVDDPPNLRRLERFLAMAHESGARPVVLLTKADLRADAHDKPAPSVCWASLSCSRVRSYAEGLTRSSLISRPERRPCSSVRPAPGNRR